MVEPGDAVMADRGFTVRDLLAEKMCLPNHATIYKEV